MKTRYITILLATVLFLECNAQTKTPCYNYVLISRPQRESVTNVLAALIANIRKQSKIRMPPFDKKELIARVN